MTFPEVQAADLAIIYAEIGVAATHAHGSTTTSVKVIKDNGFYRVQKSEIAAPDRGDALTIGNTVWAIDHIVGESENFSVETQVDLPPASDNEWFLICTKIQRWA